MVRHTRTSERDVRSWPSLAIGIIVTAITGCFVIAVLLKFLRTNSVLPFVVYRVAVGVFIIALALYRA